MARHTIGKAATRSMLALVALVGLAPACAAIAQVPPPPVDVESGDDGIRVTDLATGRVLYDQRNLRVYNNRNKPEMVIPTLEVVPQPTGMDLVYTYTNDESYDRPLSGMRVGTLVMPDSLTFQDTKMLGGQAKEMDPDNRPSIAYTYPDNTYSPVWVLRDDEQAVGVSLLYPLFEYKHDVQFRLRQAPPFADGMRGWYLDLRISSMPGDNTGRGWIDYPAILAPGETRSYTVTVRFDRKPNEWVRTLLPYRDYFRAHFGGVQYQRRTRAISGYSTGEQSTLSRNNPYGYRSERLRPDLHGFEPLVNQIMGTDGWPEVLVVKPSGQYLINRGWNFPFKMLTELQTTPELRTAFSTEIGYASIPLRGRELSLWWGRSLQVAEEWDPSEVHNLDPTSESDRRLALDELNLARQLGATGIGLDAFSHDKVPAWSSYAWLRDMIRAYPEMYFFTEPIASDVLHTLAPTWYRGWDESNRVETPDDIYRIKGPHMLADFLLPGHETILSMRYQALKQFGIDPTQSRINADTQRFASWGFRPLIYSSAFDLQTSVVATESWLQTIPEGLQIPRNEWILPMDPYNGDDPSASIDDGDDSDPPDSTESEDSSSNYIALRGGVVSRTFDRARGGSSGSKRVSTQKSTRVPAIRFNPRTDRISKPSLTPEELRTAIRRAKGLKTKDD